jgi:aerobic-type carbon monoxide dehydrogenase small subunit (CoxS/CutS family)
MKLTINGTAQDIQSSPDTPLLWVLRDELGLTGTKFSCGIGACGACTVHLNGHSIRSCSTPIGTAEGGTVTTIEGLGASGDHPVQTAWLQIAVPQCGFCQPGQIMSAVALLEKNPTPTDADIDASMEGNLCRCGTYQRIRAAIHHAADMMAPVEDTPE